MLQLGFLDEQCNSHAAQQPHQSGTHCPAPQEAPGHRASRKSYWDQSTGQVDLTRHNFHKACHRCILVSSTLKLWYINVNKKVNNNTLRVSSCRSLDKFSSLDAYFYEKFTLVKSWSHLKVWLASTTFLLLPNSPLPNTSSFCQCNIFFLCTPQPARNQHCKERWDRPKSL